MPLKGNYATKLKNSLTGVLMKNLFLASIMATILPFAVSAGELIPGTTLKLISGDGQTDLQGLTVQINSYCKYSSGIFWPESKTCGSKTTELKVAADGTVKIPAIEKFSGLKGSKTDNYEVSLSIYEGKEYLVILHARGKEALKTFNFTNRPLSLYRLNAAEINVSHAGADFFGSPASQVDRAHLFITIDNKKDNNKLGEVLVTTNSGSASIWFKENFNARSDKDLLKDQTSIKLKKLNYAMFNATENEKLTVSVHYGVSNNYSKDVPMSGTVEVALKPSALEDIGTIELLKK